MVLELEEEGVALDLALGEEEVFIECTLLCLEMFTSVVFHVK